MNTEELHEEIKAIREALQTKVREHQKAIRAQHAAEAEAAKLRMKIGSLEWEIKKLQSGSEPKGKRR